MTIRDKIVVITGSSSGIGQATAIAFAKEGAKIVVNYRVNEAGGKETVAKIKDLSGDAILIQADVTKPADVDRLFDETVKHYHSLDILINNAAIGTDKVPFMDAGYDDILEMINADLIGPMLCCQRAIKIMENHGAGKILNTSSIRGVEYGGRAIVYAASKAAINSLTKTLAKQVAPQIQVNAVAPGFVKTRNYDAMSKEQIQSYIDQTYLKRWITLEEIAETFVFLAKNDGITGQVMYVDGGFTLK